MATLQMSGSSTKENPPWLAGRVEQSGGELGIRTPDSLRGNTRLAGEHLRPLGQLFVTSVLAATKLVGWNKGKGIRAARAVMPKRLG